MGVLMKVGDLVKFGSSYPAGSVFGAGIIIGRSDDLSSPLPDQPMVLWRVWFLNSRVIHHIRSEQLEAIDDTS